MQTACQKEAYPENFINLGQPQAKWIHHLPTWPKGGHDILYQLSRRANLNERSTVFPHIVSAETILFWVLKSKGHTT